MQYISNCFYRFFSKSTQCISTICKIQFAIFVFICKKVLFLKEFLKRILICFHSWFESPNRIAKVCCKKFQKEIHLTKENLWYTETWWDLYCKRLRNTTNNLECIECKLIYFWNISPKVAFVLVECYHCICFNFEGNPIGTNSQSKLINNGKLSW